MSGKHKKRAVKCSDGKEHDICYQCGELWPCEVNVLQYDLAAANARLKEYDGWPWISSAERIGYVCDLRSRLHAANARVATLEDDAHAQQVAWDLEHRERDAANARVVELEGSWKEALHWSSEHHKMFEVCLERARNAEQERDAARAEIAELLAYRDADALIIGQAGRDIESARAEATALREALIPWLELFDSESWREDLDLSDVINASKAALAAAAVPEPPPVREMLFCPACNEPHIDEAEWAIRPHKTHLCASCGHEWRPYPHATVGIVHAAPDAREAERLEEIAQFLFARLDDIDTASDMAKDDDQAYRKLVESIHRRRFEVGATDGYAVTWIAVETPPAEPQPADPSHVHLCDYLDAIVAGRAKDCKHCNPSATPPVETQPADPSAERAGGGG